MESIEVAQGLLEFTEAPGEVPRQTQDPVLCTIPWGSGESRRQMLFEQIQIPVGGDGSVKEFDHHAPELNRLQPRI